MSAFISDTDKLRLKQVEILVCQKYHILPAQLHSLARHQHIARARFMVWCILHSPLQWSYPKIGQVFDRDHSTVVDGVQRATKIGLDKEARALWKIAQQNPLST